MRYFILIGFVLLELPVCAAPAPIPRKGQDGLTIIQGQWLLEVNDGELMPSVNPPIQVMLQIDGRRARIVTYLNMRSDEVTAILTLTPDSTPKQLAFRFIARSGQETTVQGNYGVLDDGRLKISAPNWRSRLEFPFGDTSMVIFRRVKP